MVEPHAEHCSQGKGNGHSSSNKNCELIPHIRSYKEPRILTCMSTCSVNFLPLTALLPKRIEPRKPGLHSLCPVKMGSSGLGDKLRGEELQDLGLSLEDHRALPSCWPVSRKLWEDSAPWWQMGRSAQPSKVFPTLSAVDIGHASHALGGFYSLANTRG